MDTTIHGGDGDDDDFEEYHEPTTVPVTLDVRKPMDECMEKGGEYPTALRSTVASGETHDGTEFHITQPIDGDGLYVEFDGSAGPTVELDPQQLVQSAVKAAQTRGYEIDQEGDRALEVPERVGDTVAALFMEGIIPDTQGVENVLSPDAFERFDAALENWDD